MHIPQSGGLNPPSRGPDERPCTQVVLTWITHHTNFTFWHSKLEHRHTAHFFSPSPTTEESFSRPWRGLGALCVARELRA